MSEAIVLRSAESRDDRIVTLLLPDLGRIPAVAKHARRPSKRFGGHLDPLTRAEVRLALREDRPLAVLEEARGLEAFPRLRSDLLRFALGTTMVEVVLHLVADHGHEPGVYELVLRALRRLDDPEKEATEDLLLLFEVRMLALSGHLPEVPALPSLSGAARDVLAGWLAGRWAPLPEDDRAQVARILDALVEDASGRPLKSRSFLSGLLSGGAS